MILINKGSSNKVVLTLTEKSTLLGYDTSGNLTGTTYNLFVFENDGKDQQKIFTAEDVSPYKERYNEFRIIESSYPEDLLDGQIKLTGRTSQWNYKVYESDIPFSADTLSVIWTTRKVLEEGRVLVRGNDISTPINDVYL
jgi:hypothetical protein